MAFPWPDYLPKTIRRVAAALEEQQQFGRSAHAQANVLSGGRLAKR
jgi:hypothetical protein